MRMLMFHDFFDILPVYVDGINTSTQYVDIY